jgi:hypothetical protein
MRLTYTLPHYGLFLDSNLVMAGCHLIGIMIRFWSKGSDSLFRLNFKGESIIIRTFAIAVFVMLEETRLLSPFLDSDLSRVNEVNREASQGGASYFILKRETPDYNNYKRKLLLPWTLWYSNK